MGYSKSAYDVPLDKLCQVVSLDLGVRLGLRPFSEITHSDKKEFSLLSGWRQGPCYVDPPHVERPRAKHEVELISLGMNNIIELLTYIAGFDKFL